MIASVLSLFGMKSIPWKAIGIGLAVLAIVGTIWAGKSYVEGLQNDLQTTKAALAVEQRERAAAEANAKEIRRQHDNSVARMQALEDRRTQLEGAVTELEDEIRNLTTEKDIESDPAKAAADFARQSDSLNRVLESLSRGQAPARNSAPN